MSTYEFDAKALPKNENSYDLVPNGWYEATIEDAEAMRSRNGKGCYLSITCKILNAPGSSGRVVFGNITLDSETEKAKTIGLQQLRSLLDTFGLERGNFPVNDADSSRHARSKASQFIGRMVKIKVGTKPGSNGYEAKNVINDYRPAAGAPQVAQASAVPSQPSSDPNVPPWMRNS